MAGAGRGRHFLTARREVPRRRWGFPAAESRVILTFDLDFGEIVALAGSPQPSVVVFRLRNTRTAHVIERLAEVLRSSQKALDAGAVVIVEESRHRIRHLPIGEGPA
jgi:predicted nuclease of predicted toxin-antitoxin system